MALSSVTSWLVRNCPAKEKLIFFGAGLAANVYLFLPWGDPQISLGRYLILHPAAAQNGSNESKLIAVLYPQDTIAKSVQAPFRTLFLHGHLWDLIGKVCAATAFYLTSNYSALSSFATLLPARWKTSMVAKALFQAAESPRINGNFLFALHIIDLAPVIVKIVQILLDVCRLRQDNISLEPWREKADRVGQWLQSLWFARLALVAFGTAGQFSLILTYMTCQFILRVARMFDGAPMFVFMPNLPWRHIWPLAFSADKAVLAALKALVVGSPDQLEKWMPLSQQIDAMEWGSKESWQLLSRERTQAPWLHGVFREHVYTTLATQVEEFLDTIYAPLRESKFKEFALQEKALRTIYWVNGESKIIYHNNPRLQLESIRFSLMLLMTNLIRLHKKLETEIVTEDQCKKIQCLLYLQTLESMKGEIDEREIPCCNIGDDIVSHYRAYHGMKWLNNDEVAAKIGQDPYFDGLRQMLQAVPKMGLIPEIQRLFTSLTFGMRYDYTVVPSIETTSIVLNVAEPCARDLKEKYASLQQGVTFTLAQIIAVGQTA
jgi:hypothetical protein